MRRGNSGAISGGLVTSDLSRLLSPRTIAVVGGREAERVVEQCRKIGFNGEIWPVHPNRQTMLGLPCFPDAKALPGVPDAAYVAVNRERTVDIVAQLAEVGCGGAVCYAAGFAETAGRNSDSAGLQHRLVQAAGSMPLVGPNCYGFINALDNVALWPDQHGVVSTRRGVAIITQSSNIAINLTMQTRALPVAMVLTAGNQAQLGLSELASAAIEDDRITAVGLHIEGLDDAKTFERLAVRARTLGKPIVVLKIGKSAQAQEAARTHTASLSGSDAIHDAFFKRLGVARVSSLEALLETLKLLHVHGPLPGGDLLSLSCSGGEAALVADAAVDRSIRFPPFAEDEKAKIGAILGERVAIANPLDYHTFIWGDGPAMTRMFEAALAPRFDLSCLILDMPRHDRCDESDWRDTVESFVAAVRSTGACGAVVASLPETMPEKLATELLASGIAPFTGLGAALDAAEAAATIGSAWALPLPSRLLLSKTCCENEELLSSATRVTLHEDAAKRELASSGVVTPKGCVIESDGPIDLSGLEPPFAIKVLGIAHKTEAAAVRLGLSGKQDIERARSSMAGIGNLFLVEEMARTPDAELIVGVSRDPVIGLAMTIGAGGVLAELLEDTATLLFPATEADIRTALKSLKINRLLEGWRGGDATDIDALVANIICIANYAAENAEVLEELDVNPLFATQFGSVAVDALIVKRTAP